LLGTAQGVLPEKAKEPRSVRRNPDMMHFHALDPGL
jgi:hypothetical protein